MRRRPIPPAAKPVHPPWEGWEDAIFLTTYDGREAPTPQAVYYDIYWLTDTQVFGYRWGSGDNSTGRFYKSEIRGYAEERARGVSTAWPGYLRAFDAAVDKGLIAPVLSGAST